MCGVGEVEDRGEWAVSEEYPTDDEMLTVLSSSVPRPVLDAIQSEAKATDRRVRKVVGELLMEAQAMRVVRKRLEERNR